MRCLLCIDSPCSKICKNGDPARAIRAIRFGNEQLAGQWLAPCTDAELAAAEQACIHYDRPIRLRELREQVVAAAPSPQPKAVSLAIDF